MRVHYTGSLSRSGEPVYRQGPVKWCCAAMCATWNVAVGFGAGIGGWSTGKDVNLLRERSQASSKPVLELLPISHCPFCGEVVETSRAK